jgi:hypothetical protein
MEIIMNMSKMTKALVVGLALTGPVVAMAATPGAGILGTRHDFATRAEYMATQTDGHGVLVPATDSVGQCSYCHTPHSAISTSLLWNHTLSGSTFTWDEATTTGGTAYASLAPSYKGPTVKCLSCHDGSVAIGDVALYMEGPGNFNTFKITGGPQIGSGGSMKGNHPVGMAYPYGQAVNTYNSTTTGPNVALTEFQADPTVATANAKIKLYNNTGGNITGGAATGTSGLECSTCHDPHNKQTTDDLFLRGKLAGSTQAGGYICLQCHIK